jgi:hypothetical protein
MNGKIAIVTRLLEKDADLLDIKDNLGKTALRMILDGAAGNTKGFQALANRLKHSHPEKFVDLWIEE